MCSQVRGWGGMVWPGVVQPGHTDLGVRHAVEDIAHAVDRLDGCGEDDIRDDTVALVRRFGGKDRRDGAGDHPCVVLWDEQHRARGVLDLLGGRVEAVGHMADHAVMNEQPAVSYTHLTLPTNR